MIETKAPIWETELPATAAIVPEIRGAVTKFARAHGAGDQVVGDIALAVTEAVTNAIMHAYVGRPPGTIKASAHAATSIIVVHVCDDGRGMAPRPDSPGLGLGLPMIGQLTKGCDIREGPAGTGTEVRMTFAAPGVAGRGPAGHDHSEVRLLSEVARLADGGGWPAEGIDRLLSLLVPQVADAGVLDLVDELGNPSRIAGRVRVDDDADARLTAWLASRRPRQEQIDAVLDALRMDGWHLIEVTAYDELDRLAHDDEDAAAMAEIGTVWWLNLPLGAGERLLGSLGLGFRLERGSPYEQEEFLRALADRVARGLANTQLVEELRRTRSRLERILDALVEAVLVTDVNGRVVYANRAALELLGARSVDDLLSATSDDLEERFEVVRTQRLDEESPLSVNIVEDVSGRPEAG